MPADAPGKVIRDTDAEALAVAARLIRTARHGALAVLDPESGAPVASRVAVAADRDGVPLVLLSSLAAHTKGLLNDPRCSLLLGDPGKGDPLAHPRITLACRALQLEQGSRLEEEVRARYLARQPKAKLYAGFADFSFFRLEPESASLVAGFGGAYRLTRKDLLWKDPEPGA